MHRLAISLKWKSMKAHHLIFELALSALAVPLQTPEAETASSYVVSIYDTVSNGQKAYSFYIENGRVTAFDLVDYS